MFIAHILQLMDGIKLLSITTIWLELLTNMICFAFKWWSKFPKNLYSPTKPLLAANTCIPNILGEYKLIYNYLSILRSMPTSQLSLKTLQHKSSLHFRFFGINLFLHEQFLEDSSLHAYYETIGKLNLGWSWEPSVQVSQALTNSVFITWPSH